MKMFDSNSRTFGRAVITELEAIPLEESFTLLQCGDCSEWFRAEQMVVGDIIVTSPKLQHEYGRSAGILICAKCFDF